MYCVVFFSQSCDFVKKRGDTVLRVVWNGDLRLIDTGPKAAPLAAGSSPSTGRSAVARAPSTRQ